MSRYDRIKMRPLLYRTCVVLLVLLLSACATQPTTMTDPERDPWESYNRKIHAFNMGLDKAILRPVAKGYDYIMPDAPQRGVRNFFRNLAYPVIFLNLLLQGRFEDSLTATGRFEDMGQTLAVWGWKDSRYLVMPLFGPFTARDFIGRGFYGYFHPVSYWAREHNNYLPMAVDLLTLRASLLPFDKDIDSAEDPYTLIRDAWLQRREFLIYDGDPPAPDYDALLEDY